MAKGWNMNPTEEEALEDSFLINLAWLASYLRIPPSLINQAATEGMKPYGRELYWRQVGRTHPGASKICEELGKLDKLRAIRKKRETK